MERTASPARVSRAEKEAHELKQTMPMRGSLSERPPWVPTILWVECLEGSEYSVMGTWPLRTWLKDNFFKITPELLNKLKQETAYLQLFLWCCKPDPSLTEKDRKLTIQK